MKFRLLGFILLCLGIISCSNDQPTKLSGKIETIDLEYIRWACDCAEYVETKYMGLGLDLEEKCIFIEPSKRENRISEEYFNGKHHDVYLRLTGQYYLDRGIPNYYEQKTPKKANYARVFRYDKVEYVNK